MNKTPKPPPPHEAEEEPEVIEFTLFWWDPGPMFQFGLIEPERPKREPLEGDNQ